MPIAFETIPANLRIPGHFVEFDASMAVRGLPGMPFRALLIGQRLSTGTIAQNVLKQITDPSQARTYFGNGSLLHHMAEVFRRQNQFTELWAIAVDDAGAGVQASGTLTITGPATASGTIYLYIAGRRITVGVTSGDAQNSIAANINTAIQAETSLPVTSGVSTNVVTLTARHKGLVGNEIDLRVNYREGENTPAGVGISIVAMASGATNPTLTSTIAALGDEWFQVIVNPWTDSTSLSALEAEMLARWGAMRPYNGHLFAGKRDTFANLSSFGSGRNSQFSTFIGANESPTPSYEWAAALSGVAAQSLFLDPARPLQTLPLIGVLPPVSTKLFTQAERNLLLFDGIATWTRDVDGTVRAERVITSYQTNAAGATDPSYLDVETMFTAARLRFDLRTRLALRYPRHKLADDGTRFGAGQVVATPKSVKAELVALYAEWEALGLVEDSKAFAASLIVERAANDPNRLDILLPPNLVNQLRLTATKIQFIV